MNFVSLLLIVYSSFLYLPNVENSKNPENSLVRQVIDSLSNLLNFFQRDSVDLNIDGIFGIRIAQGQLQIIKKNLIEENDRSSSNEIFLVDSFSSQIDKIVNESLKNIRPEDNLYFKRFSQMVSSPFMVESRIRLIKRNLIDNGEKNEIFDEIASDQCFGELLGSNDDHSRQCFVSESCWNSMTQPKQKNYVLTHQLLWFIVAETIGCFEKKNVSMAAKENLIRLEDQFCSNIFEDATRNIENNENQDLFLEQVLLCSIVGFRQFLRSDWLLKILSWQNPNYGCFDDSTRIRTRRRLLFEQEMLHGCLSHKSGLAAGVLASYLRNYFD